MYKVPGESGPLVIQCFHEFQVFKNNQLISFKTAKVKELFAYLFTYKNTYIHRDLLIENLWPEQEYKKAKINLHTCISHLRKLFSQLGYESIISFSNQCYCLILEDFDCDASTFYQIASNSGKVDNSNIKLIEEAIYLYSGGYCEMNGYKWANESYLEYHQLMTSLLRRAIDYIKDVDLTKALSYSQQFLKLNPYSDEVVNQMMDLHISMGNYSNAIKVFQDYRQLLNDELGIEPNNILTDVFDKLKLSHHRS
ncbi:hypothetical protein MTP04_38830 [Lysinibacillus sp. PLM2]|nr:hypothetical protein MTP04_38830 [Lysinibacillus sp. PLM2]